MNIFVSGIGGAGLGPLAEIALDAGFSVIGSDLRPSLVSQELEKRGARIYYEQTTDNIARIHAQKPIDWFVYTSALPNDAPELVFARDNNIRATKRDEFLAELIKQKNLSLIAVAGTHGKTTTTAMLIWTFHKLDLPVSYSVGTTLPFGNSGHFDQRSRFFIYEADEYDRNFLHFSPKIAAIPALDYDHADIYPTRDNYNEAFRQFISQSDLTILWHQAYNQLFSQQKTNDNLLVFDQSDDRIFNLPGVATRQDAFLAREVLRNALDNFHENKVTKILNDFPGTSRRFEKIFTNQKSGGLLFSDYAHTPAEIAATVEKAHEIARRNEQKVVAIYEPHQNARQIAVMQEGGYGDCFTGADDIVWLPTYLVRNDLVDNAPEVVVPDELIATLDKKSQKNAQLAELGDNLWQKITYDLDNGDLVLAMGAGTIDGWLRSKLS